MLKAIALDDEPLALEVIKMLAEKVVFLKIAACFTDAFEGMEYLRLNHADLIFLDINMPDINGIDFLKALPKPPMVIFTTAYSEHAVQSFELDAIDYLLKPFSMARFLKACNKASEQAELRKKAAVSAPAAEFLFIKSGYGQIRVQVGDILYAESCGNYVQFVLEKQKIVSRLTMAEAGELLPAADFIRIHRSCIVAKNQITRVEKRSVWVKGIELPVGAGYQNGIEKIIK
jgi:DNA-binding LytR/AlgR family response regulator